MIHSKLHLHGVINESNNIDFEKCHIRVGRCSRHTNIALEKVSFA